MTTPYLPNSKLKRVEFHMTGIKSAASFTCWSWNLLGVSCALNAWLAYQATYNNNDNDNNNTINPLLLRTAILLFEIVAPVVLLIGFVVKYALWPQALSHGTGNNPSAPLKTYRALLMHNFNVWIVLLEVALLSGLPIRVEDFGVAALYGCCYIVFTWSTLHIWAAPEHGPQTIYFFFDTTLGAKMHVLSILALLVLLLFFYALFCGLHAVLDHLGGGIAAHSLAVVLVASLVCRYRD